MENYSVEIKEDFKKYVENKKIYDLLLNHSKQFAIKGSFCLSAKKGVEIMLNYYEETNRKINKIREFEKIIEKFDLNELEMINDMLYLTVPDCAIKWECSTRTVHRRQSQINKKYLKVKYGKIDK